MPFLLSQKQTLMPPVPLSLCKPPPSPRSTEQFLWQVILTVNLPGARNTEEASLWREALLRSHSVRGNVQSHSGFMGPSLYTESIIVRHVVHECASWLLYCLFLLLLVSPMQGRLPWFLLYFQDRGAEQCSENIDRRSEWADWSEILFLLRHSPQCCWPGGL